MGAGVGRGVKKEEMDFCFLAEGVDWDMLLKAGIFNQAPSSGYTFRTGDNCSVTGQMGPWNGRYISILRNVSTR